MKYRIVTHPNKYHVRRFRAEEKYFFSWIPIMGTIFSTVEEVHLKVKEEIKEREFNKKNKKVKVWP